MKPFLRTANSPSIVYWTRLSVSPSCKMPRKRSKIASSPAQEGKMRPDGICVSTGKEATACKMSE